MPGLEDFYRWDGPRPEVEAGGRRFHLPLHYHDDEFMASLHTASYDAVAAELPSEAIRPARWRDGRALVSVAAFRYDAVSVRDDTGAISWLRPYAEVSVAAVVTLGQAPRMLPVLHPRLHVFVLHLPVTTREARDIGTLWGFPKFVADLDFVEQPRARQVSVAEDDQLILRLTVRPSGIALPDHHPHVCYTALDGELVETVVPMSGYRQIRLGRGAGRLALGSHPVARRLARLDISPEPLAVFSYLTHRTLLPAGRGVAPARPYRGHPGSERPLGRYTIRYPDATPFDRYAPAPHTPGTPAPAAAALDGHVRSEEQQPLVP